MLTNALKCRLCEAPVQKEFALKILGKYEVDYLCCGLCDSLQTTEPIWLEETYSGKLPNLDEGAARRASRTSAVVMLAARIVGLKTTARLLDFGGGDGLTCRLLRDIGFDAYCYDKFAKNVYSDGYVGDPEATYDIVIAVELLEHLSYPQREIGQIFSKMPTMIILTTEFYHGQGPEWAYLGNEHGGHVFFYSRRSLAMIAKKFGYEVAISRDTAVFWRGRLAKWRRFLIKQIVRPEVILIGKVWMQAIKPRRE